MTKNQGWRGDRYEHSLAARGIKTKSVGLVSWDWKDTEGGIDEIQKTLKELGLHMYEDPVFEGSDTYGFIISKQPLTKQQLQMLAYHEIHDPDSVETEEDATDYLVRTGEILYDRKKDWYTDHKGNLVDLSSYDGSWWQMYFSKVTEHEKIAREVLIR